MLMSVDCGAAKGHIGVYGPAAVRGHIDVNGWY